MFYRFAGDRKKKLRVVMNSNKKKNSYQKIENRKNVRENKKKVTPK